jgi:16S rRNA (uracil1498-N3)-methyltransferase
MNRRFFVPPDAVAQDRVIFDNAMSHQLCHVLRMRPGMHVTVLDNSGMEYEVELVTLERKGTIGRICAKQMAQTEPSVRLTLYQCVLKGERFEWVLQKGTELGVNAFVPVISERTIVQDSHLVEKKHSRWERIIQAAASQSRRGRLPALHKTLSLDRALRQAVDEHTFSLIPWENAHAQSLADVLHACRPPLPDIGLFIGPEGGFDPSEIALAERSGLQVTTMGPRILRAETAATVAVAIIMYEMQELQKAEI